MKRGNTALKRGVGLASAFALAVAGAVLAAPAANAFQVAPVSGGGLGSMNVDLTDIVRATPVADSAYVDANGAVDTAGGHNSTYRHSTTLTPLDGNTGVAPQIKAGATGQDASGAQIKLPIVDGTDVDTVTAGNQAGQWATWRPGDQLVLTLPQGVTFTEAPEVGVSDLVDLQEADSAAGYDAKTGAVDTATSFTALKANGMKDTTTPTAKDVAPVKPAISSSLSSDGKTLTLTFTSNQWGVPNSTGNEAAFNANALQTSADATYNTYNSTTKEWTGAEPAGVEPGYLLSLSKVKLSVTDSALAGAVALTVRGYQSNGLFGATGYAVTPATQAVTCVGTGAAGSANYVGGATTIAWVIPGEVAVAEQTLVPGTNLQPLSDVTVKELVVNGWANGSFVLSGTITGGAAASFEYPAHTPAIAGVDAEGASETGLTATAFAPSSGAYDSSETSSTVTFTLGGADDAKIQSLTIKNLRITNNVPGNSKLTLKLTPTIPANAGLSLNQQSTYSCLTGYNDSTFSHSPRGLDQFVAGTDVPFAPTVSRYAGVNRFDTARLIAANFGTNNQAVVVANGENWKGGFDALSASYLAGVVEGGAGVPIILTQSNILPRESAQAIRYALSGAPSNLTRTVYVMGGQDSVSGAVENQIRSLFASDQFDIHVVRVADKNRFATSADSATYAGTQAVGRTTFTWGQAELKTAIIASGENNADALSAGAISFAEHFPILLTAKGALDPAVKDAIRSLGIQQVLILGGEDRVSAAVVTELGTLGVTSTKRIAGKDRYETAALLATWAYANGGSPSAKDAGLGWNDSTAYLANGVTGWPDALTVGPLAGSSGSALLTNGQATLAPSVEKFLGDHNTTLDSVIGLGKDATISQVVLNKANGLV